MLHGPVMSLATQYLIAKKASDNAIGISQAISGMGRADYTPDTLNPEEVIKLCQKEDAIIMITISL